MCKGLPPEATSTSQSDLPLLNQSVSRVHRARRTISEIPENEEEEVFSCGNTHTQKEIKAVFLILLHKFQKLYSVHCQMKTQIIIKTK
jgi:hypothetical protein